MLLDDRLPAPAWRMNTRILFKNNITGDAVVRWSGALLPADARFIMLAPAAHHEGAYSASCTTMPPRTTCAGRFTPRGREAPPHSSALAAEPRAGQHAHTANKQRAPQLQSLMTIGRYYFISASAYFQARWRGHIMVRIRHIFRRLPIACGRTATITRRRRALPRRHTRILQDYTMIGPLSAMTSGR